MTLPNARPAVLPITLAIVLAAAAPAQAVNHYHADSGGAACHPASGAASAKFTRSNHTLTNINTTDQYVVCSMSIDDIYGEPTRQVGNLTLWFTAGSTGGTPTCSVQTGKHYAGHTQLSSAVTRSVVVAANTGEQLVWNGAELNRLSYHDVVTVSCRVPPGFRIGLLDLTDVDWFPRDGGTIPP